MWSKTPDNVGENRSTLGEKEPGDEGGVFPDLRDTPALAAGTK
jgi:hypothetical protein